MSTMEAPPTADRAEEGTCLPPRVGYDTERPDHGVIGSQSSRAKESMATPLGRKSIPLASAKHQQIQMGKKATAWTISSRMNPTSGLSRQ